MALVFKRTQPLTEEVLEPVDALNLTNTISRAARDVAMEELLRDVRELQAKSKLNHDEALAYVRERRPRLFRATRLNPTNSSHADIVMLE